jgi:hypothetical protein
MRASAFLAVSLASRVVAFSPSSRVGARVLGPNRFSARLYSQAAYRGPTQERVEAALQESFSPTFLEVSYSFTRDIASFAKSLLANLTSLASQ